MQLVPTYIGQGGEGIMGNVTPPRRLVYFREPGVSTARHAGMTLRFTGMYMISNQQAVQYTCELIMVASMNQGRLRRGEQQLQAIMPQYSVQIWDE